LDLRAGGARDGAADPGGDLNLADNERRLIRAALLRVAGNKSQAAKLLGITRRTLYSRLKLLDLEGE
ncbi:helix-turn-helix domain-containing protein, partial [bacterium]|nr:helix-turn-helix domain-containing protein [bacterium]